MRENKKLAVLVSGTGTNLQALIDAVNNKEIKNTEISIVISNSKNAYALTRASNANLKTLFLDPKDFAANIEYDKKLIEILSAYNVDLIILAGYLRILSEVFVNRFSKKIINIHPALLPKFSGKGMYGKKVHDAVLKNKEKESGCTVHFVTSEIDTGPIVSQVKVPVLESDTVEVLQERVLKQEHKLLVESVKKILFGVYV